MQREVAPMTHHPQSHRRQRQPISKQRKKRHPTTPINSSIPQFHHHHHNKPLLRSQPRHRKEQQPHPSACAATLSCRHCPSQGTRFSPPSATTLVLQARCKTSQTKTSSQSATVNQSALLGLGCCFIFCSVCFFLVMGEHCRTARKEGRKEGGGSKRHNKTKPQNKSSRVQKPTCNQVVSGVEDTSNCKGEKWKPFFSLLPTPTQVSPTYLPTYLPTYI